MSTSTAASGSTHNAAIDVIRMAALAAIVIGHVYSKDELADRLIQSWRLPIFFMLSGYFWSLRRNARQEFRHRCRTLLFPYLGWLGILLSATILVVLMKDPATLGSSMGRALLGGSYATRPFTTFWFFTALFVAVVLYRFLLLLPTVFRIGIVAAGVLANVLFGGLLAMVPYSVATAWGTLIFIEVGRAIRWLNMNSGPQVQVGMTAGLLAFAVSVLLLVDDFVPLDIKVGRFPPLAMVVAAALGAAFLLTAALLPPLNDSLARVFRRGAATSVAIILLHPAVLWVLPPESGQYPLWIVAVAGFFGPLALGLFLARGRFAQLLLGVRAEPVRARAVNGDALTAREPSGPHLREAGQG